MIKNKIAAGMAALALALGGLVATADVADAAPKNPWNKGLVIKHTERLSNGDWKRYAKSKGAVHVGKVGKHARCWAIVGPTSWLKCKDGFTTSS